MGLATELAIGNRRKDPRYAVLGEAIAYIGNRKCRVVDVGKGGMGVRFDEKYVPSDYQGNVDIELSGEDFFLGSVPVKSMSHCELEEEFIPGAKTTTRCGVAFGDLKSHQRFKLEYFIWLCTQGSA